MSPEDWERYYTGYYNDQPQLIDEEDYTDE